MTAYRPQEIVKLAAKTRANVPAIARMISERAHLDLSNAKVPAS